MKGNRREEGQAVYISPDGISYPEPKTAPKESSWTNRDNCLVYDTSLGVRVMSAPEHPSLMPGTLGTIVSFEDQTISGTI